MQAEPALQHCRLFDFESLILIAEDTFRNVDYFQVMRGFEMYSITIYFFKI